MVYSRWLFSAYQSTLKGLNKIVGTYDGLGNYVKAIDNLTYVLGFWLAITFLYLSIKMILGSRKTAEEHSDNYWIWAIPGLVTAVAISLFARFFSSYCQKCCASQKKRPEANLSPGRWPCNLSAKRGG
ncbi:MAG: hypothetical protein M5U34_09620 [Chloroflexi bacterium]|nr:hypothetical protein [Chloroflexota bacterium]